jgi:hypothetical protein
MVILQVICTIAFLFILSAIFGLVFQSLFKKSDLFAMLPEGFLFFLAIFQVISTPLLIFHAPYRFALIEFFILLAAGLIALLVQLKRGQIQLPRLSIAKDLFLRITLGLALISVLGQAVISTVFVFSDADDIYYVGLANSNIDSPELYKIDPSTGNPNYPVIAQYRFESYELLMGVVSDLSGLPTAGVFHSVLPFVLICLAYLAYAALGRLLVSDNMVPLWIILLSIFHLFGGYSPFSQGSYLLTRVWQGKSILLHLLIPLVMMTLIQFRRQQYPTRTIVQMVILLLAGIAVTPVAVFLPSTILALYCGFFFLEEPHQWKRIAGMFLSLAPLAIYALGIRSGVIGSVGTNYLPNPFHPLTVYKSFFRTGWPYYAAYLILAFYYLRRGNFEQRVIFGYSPLALVVFVYNPLLAPYIARFITGYSTFWRMLWLIPVGIGLAGAIVDVFNRKRTYSYILFVLFLGYGLLNHSFLLTSLTLPVNLEKLPAEQVQLANFVASNYGSKAVVLAPEDISVTVRQVSSLPQFFWSRQDYIFEFTADGKKNKEFERRFDLETILYSNDEMPVDVIKSELSHYGINLIVAPKSQPELLSKLEGYENVLETSNYILFHIPE